MLHVWLCFIVFHRCQMPTVILCLHRDQYFWLLLGLIHSNHFFLLTFLEVNISFMWSLVFFLSIWLQLVLASLWPIGPYLTPMSIDKSKTCKLPESSFARTVFATSSQLWKGLTQPQNLKTEEGDIIGLIWLVRPRGAVWQSNRQTKTISPPTQILF